MFPNSSAFWVATVLICLNKMQFASDLGWHYFWVAFLLMIHKLKKLSNSRLRYYRMGYVYRISKCKTSFWGSLMGSWHFVFCRWTVRSSKFCPCLPAAAGIIVTILWRRSLTLCVSADETRISVRISEIDEGPRTEIERGRTGEDKSRTSTVEKRGTSTTNEDDVAPSINLYH